MIAIRGINSKIAQELIKLLPTEEYLNAFAVGRDPVPGDSDLWHADRYFFCQGLLRPCQIGDQTEAERAEGFSVNAGQVIGACDRILETNPKARICVMGSESGFAWSYDGVYAAAKAALHRYVETKRLKPDQQLVCVAPSIIADAGMTTRRDDQEILVSRLREHPKRRFLMSEEVARMVHFLLYVDHGYTTGVVIRMNGGAHTA